MSNKVAKQKLQSFPKEVQQCEVDAEGSTLTTVMMHLAQMHGSPLGGCFARPFGQQGTT